MFDLLGISFASGCEVHACINPSYVARDQQGEGSLVSGRSPSQVVEGPDHEG